MPKPTKGAIQNYSGGLAQLLAEKGIRVNAVAPSELRVGCNILADQPSSYTDLMHFQKFLLSF